MVGTAFLGMKTRSQTREENFSVHALPEKEEEDHDNIPKEAEDDEYDVSEQEHTEDEDDDYNVSEETDNGDEEGEDTRRTWWYVPMHLRVLNPYLQLVLLLTVFSLLASLVMSWVPFACLWPVPKRVAYDLGSNVLPRMHLLHGHLHSRGVQHLHLPSTHDGRKLLSALNRFESDCQEQPAEWVLESVWYARGCQIQPPPCLVLLQNIMVFSKIWTSHPTPSVPTNLSSTDVPVYLFGIAMQDGAPTKDLLASWRNFELQHLRQDGSSALYRSFGDGVYTALYDFPTIAPHITWQLVVLVVAVLATVVSCTVLLFRGLHLLQQPSTQVHPLQLPHQRASKHVMTPRNQQRDPAEYYDVQKLNNQHEIDYRKVDYAQHVHAMCLQSALDLCGSSRFHALLVVLALYYKLS